MKGHMYAVAVCTYIYWVIGDLLFRSASFKISPNFKLVESENIRFIRKPKVVQHIAVI